MDIGNVSEETRKRLYDRLDPDRTIANGVWNGAPLSEFEAFIAKCLGYLVDKAKAEKIEARSTAGKPKWDQKMKGEAAAKAMRANKRAMKLRQKMGGVCFNPEHNIFCLATGPDCQPNGPVV